MMNLEPVQFIGRTLLLALMGVVSLFGSDHDADFLVVTHDPEVEQALQISKADMLRNRRVKNGVIGFAPGGYYNGIWMTDSTFLMSAYRYWGSGHRDFLYSDRPGALGLVPRFAAAQAPDGLIPMAIVGDEGRIEYGGRLDLAQKRKESRDMESPYMFVHVNYMYWKDTADLTYARRYGDAMRRALQPIDHRRDAATGLILMTYGIPNSDVCVDYAIPQTTAEPYFNALYVRAYLEYADMAEALGDAAEAKVYRAKAEALRQAVNRYSWIPARNRYEMRILRTPVSSDPTLPASAIKEDTRFPVVDNMLLIYYGIPDSQERVRALIHLINETEKGLAVVGRMVVPPYPDGFITREKLFDGGNYHNGDVWTWFSNQYAIALYRLGYPDSADHALRSQARVAIRDKGFSEYYEDDAIGAAKGASHYGPTAAAFQSAVVEGLFGLELDAPSHTLSVHPSLSRSGKLRVRLGGKPAEVSLDVQAQRKEMLLRVESGLTVQGDFRVMVPEGFKAGGKWTVSRQSGGESIPVRCSVVSLAEAAYVRFKAELGPGAETFRLSQGGTK
jgi:hypothetical protein